MKEMQDAALANVMIELTVGEIKSITTVWHCILQLASGFHHLWLVSLHLSSQMCITQMQVCNKLDISGHW